MAQPLQRNAIFRVNVTAVDRATDALLFFPLYTLDYVDYAGITTACSGRGFDIESIQIQNKWEFLRNVNSWTYTASGLYKGAHVQEKRIINSTWNPINNIVTNPILVVLSVISIYKPKWDELITVQIDENQREYVTN